MDVRKAVAPQASPMAKQVQPKEQVYELPVYRKMKAKDGSEVEIEVNVVRITKKQLEASIADAQAKLAAIVALEEKEQPVRVEA